MGFFLINLIFSFAVAYVASKKGRNPAGWFIFAFFFQIIALILIIVLPNLNEEKARRAWQSAALRRQKETIHQERSVNRQFRRHVLDRLDQHDEVLGLPPVKNKPAEMPAIPGEIDTFPIVGDGSWFLVINGEEKGPLAEPAVLQMLRHGEISGETYVWSHGMDDWLRAKKVGNFQQYC